MGAATGAHNIGIADNDIDRFERHPEQIGRYLRETRLVTLSARLGADHDIDLSDWLDGDLGSLVR